jgi:hypothetical protein
MGGMGELHTHDAALWVWWDEDAGTFWGRGARHARELVANARQSWPHASSHELSDDPARSRVDIAAIFGQLYLLPPWLDGARPAVESVVDDAEAARELIRRNHFGKPVKPTVFTGGGKE